MKIILIFGLILSLLTTSYAGESGGGGDLEPSRKNSPESVENHIRSEIIGGKQLIKLFYGIEFYLKGHASSKPSNGLNVKVLLFSKNAAGNVYDILDKIDWSIPTSSNCIRRVKRGNQIEKIPSDGAVISKEKLKACISARRISEETTQSDFNKVILGLMAHEVTHLMGGSEENASYISKLVDRQYRVRNIFNDSSHITMGLEDLVESVNFGFDLLFSKNSKFSISDQAVYLQSLANQACEIKNYAFDELDSLSSAVNIAAFNQIKDICLQARLAVIYAVSKTYLSTFHSHIDQDKSLFTYDEFYKGSGEKSETLFYVPVLQNPVALKNAVASIKKTSIAVLKQKKLTFGDK